MYSSLILLPFFGVIVLNLPFRALMKKCAFWLCLSIVLFQICLILFPQICCFSDKLDALGSFFKFDFAVDSLSRVMLFCIGIVLFTALFVQRNNCEDEDKIFNFANVSLLILCGMNGVVMVKDIFSLYVFLEITAVSSFILIAFNKESVAFEGAFKYIILSAVATVLMLAAIALFLVISGDTGFSAISSALKVSQGRFFIGFAVGIFLCACFIKSGLVPFHGWVPDAYSSAPASVSVLLAGVVTKTVGIYTLIRIVNSIFGFGDPIKHLLLAVGAISIVVGALAALGQKDIKRMLAYSSISQVGYIVIGLGTGTALGLTGAIFHLFNHSIFKSLLFVNSAAVESETGTRDMDKLSGLAKKMPLTGITSILGSLSCAGIPPLAGFWSKLIIIIALWVSGFRGYAIIAVLASVLTLAYFLSWQRSVFFGILKEDLANVKEAGFGLVFPALILAVIIVGVGIFFPLFINSFALPIENILGG
ncbi:MAG: NADH-quinone oxidoreductase subunit L [Candidatus Omnitrophica bacterium]|nr:NADH-quinone oxidoreductase subunit L [Candidatus Omnitrophota bacterium]